ncbi:MAG: multicopper oxidase domain-containing protein, partial [Candidatus Eremiobacteraeota bacterium]|nr:multicopper oxidase domain-containing protein [Candidatus Eremiobacteraeota bacterium]
SETLAVRGAASADYPYLGGAENGSQQPSSLPFTWEQAGSTRPALPRTIRVTLTPAGLLTASVDLHDGNGFTTYYSKNIVGLSVSGTCSNAPYQYTQPPVPATVYVGFSAGTGGAWSQKQVANFNVSTLPTAGSFAPTQITGLQAWYDASNAANFTLSSGKVASWNDSSGNNNTLQQKAAAAQPSYTSSGFSGLGAVSFGGANYLVGSNAKFSSNLFGASSVFVVSNAPPNIGQRVLMWSGSYASNPRWSLYETRDAQGFQFNGSSGQIATVETASGPAIWTAAGSSADKQQLLRKNGTLIGRQLPIAAPSSGSAPLALGATIDSGGVGHAPYLGQIAEVLVYNSLLTTAQQQSVEGYLACKWGLQGRLPANHPFRTVCPQSAGPGTPQPTPAPVAGSLQNPPQLISQNGLLVFNVTASQLGNGNPNLYYNGSPKPPTLRLLPGDTLIVNFVNNLPAPPGGALYKNDANLHFHGLHVSPNSPADDSIDLLATPGQTLHYRVPIPANAPPGLFWYHSHVHGEAERQNLAGMSGAIVVDGIARYVQALSQLPERIFVVRDAELNGHPLPDANPAEAHAMQWAMSHGGMNGMHMAATSNEAPFANPYVLLDPDYRTFKRPAADTHCTTKESPVLNWTINGLPTNDPKTLPTIGIRPGEQQFWRVLNAGSDSYLDLAVDNATMTVVAVDGVPVSLGKGIGASIGVSHWVLPPASRVEFLVTGPPAGAAPSYLRTNCFDDGPAGPPMPATKLAVLDPAHSPTDIVTQRVPYGPARAVHDAAFLKAHAVARTQTIYYSDQNSINGVPYDPSKPPTFYAQSGTVEEWTIVNNSQQGHTFHIHQIHFLVEAINGVTQAQQFMMDNVNVPPATGTGPGTVKILVDFTDPLVIGTFLLHCHILSHEDGGMMAKIRVGTSPPLNVTPSSITFTSTGAKPQSVTISGGKTPYGLSGCTGIVNATLVGTSVSLVPQTSGTCVLTVSDNTGLSGNVSVTVEKTPPVVQLKPGSVSFTSPNAAAQNVTISGGTPPYTPAGCAGVVTSALTTDTLKLTPVAGGSCTITVTDSKSNSNNLAVSVNVPTGGLPQDNDTFHQNPLRTGWYQHETTLTTTNVASSTFKMQTTLQAPAGLPPMGKVYAQPLYAANELMPDSKEHNLVIIASSTDQVYAFDDVTRKMLWHRDFTNPASGIRQQEWTDDGCPDVEPNLGIVGTPVIDRNADLMYVVVPTMENGTPYQRLHAISLKTGLDATDGQGHPIGPTVITASVSANGGTASLDPLNNFNRGALLEANGNIYVAEGSHCDMAAGTTHGWILSYSATTLQATGSALNITADNQSGFFLGSPWMGGFGPAADASGNIYFASGNGPDPGTNPNDFGMSIMNVPGNLDLTSVLANGTWFSPATAANDSGADADLGSGGVMLFPDQTAGSIPHLLAQGGKCGGSGCQLYVLNRDNMGKQQANDAGAAYHFNTNCGMWGGPAYFEDASSNQYVVYGCGPLVIYKLGLTPNVTLTQAGSANTGGLGGRDSGSQPVISSNGTKAGTAIAWVLSTPGNGGGGITLIAVNLLNPTQSANGCSYNNCIFKGAVTPPATTLTASAASGATTFTLASLTGIAAGTTISINDSNSEQLLVQSVNPSSNTITTATPSGSAHSSGAGANVVAWSQTPGAAWIGEALVSILVANGTVYVPMDNGVAVFGLK